jgi:hypothetical protein
MLNTEEGDLLLGMAVFVSMTAIGLVLDYLHGDVKENREMLKKIQEKLGIEEEKK